MNRNPWLFEDAQKFAMKGGNVDFTTSTTEQIIADGEVPSSKALKIMLDKGIPVCRITFSSDAQGSLPLFDDKGNLTGLTI